MYNDNLMQLESLLLGQSGMLSSVDDYTDKLQREYIHLKNKYKLEPMNGVEWRFSRMRPGQFPTLRIVQIAYLYNKVSRIISNYYSIHLSTSGKTSLMLIPLIIGKHTICQVGHQS